MKCTVPVIQQQTLVTDVSDEPHLLPLITDSLFMSYWPTKFHTYIQPWLTGLCGIITFCCYRDQRNCEKKAVFTQDFYLGKIKKIKNPHYCRRYATIRPHSSACPSTSHTHINGRTQTLFPLSDVYTWPKKNKTLSSLCRYGMRESHIADSQPPWPRDQNKLQGGSLNIDSEWKKSMLAQESALSDPPCTVTSSPRLKHKSPVTAWLHDNDNLRLLLLSHRRCCCSDFALLTVLFFFYTHRVFSCILQISWSERYHNFLNQYR